MHVSFPFQCPEIELCWCIIGYRKTLHVGDQFGNPPILLKISFIEHLTQPFGQSMIRLDNVFPRIQ